MGITLHLDIVSPESALFSGRVERVTVSGVQGELGIMPGHTPLLTKLKPGVVRLVLQGGETDVFYLSGGMLEVQPDTVTILADTVLRAADLDEVAAQAARREAEQKLSQKRAEIDYSATLAELAQAAAQLHAIQQLRKKIKGSS